MTKATADTVLQFWFGSEADDTKTAEQQNKLWWSKDDAVDQEISERFKKSTLAAANGELDEWAEQPRDLLALILLTDQFPRNMYRGLPTSFAFDALALQWSLIALDHGFERHLRPIERVFLYLPLEHSEVLEHQHRSVALFEQLLQDVPAAHKQTFSGFVQFAIRHRDIVARFGRFPHRNAIFGRDSTTEELAFLQTAGSSF
ncbi:Uncharacterized conserved protein [Janthinobacterium sp. Marseille]|nr:DUF924 family protein [Janthinobacterium sp. Marseille]ABR88633.1 Uncharacterized conserved protein [Janthinobacterium sp. Marseille]